MKLEGIRVIDLARFLPGPWMGMMMADHGADVIKIEDKNGEPTRKLGPRLKGHSAYYRNTQRGKRSLKLDLKASQGLEVFHKLAASSDVIIESFRPGVAARLGIDYDTVRKLNPGIVYCGLSAFGQSGSMADRPSHDLGAEALSGVLSLSQHEQTNGGNPPSLPSLPMADIALGGAALNAILMALFKRSQSGEGDFIDAAMIDALMSWTPHILSPVIAEKRNPTLTEERLHGGAAFYNIYQTKDQRYIVLSGSEMKFVRNLLNALGRPDLIALCEQGWGEVQAPVIEFLQAQFATRTLSDWDEWLRDKDVCYAPVLSLKEAWDTPIMREREMVHAGADGVMTLGTPFKFRHEPGSPNGTLAVHGQHSASILEELGYDSETCQQLAAKGVI